MKKFFLNTKIFALALATVLTTSVTVPALANDEDKKAEVKYLGNVNDMPIYRLSLNNDATATYIVTIMDADGNILYTEKVSGTNIVRNYQLDSDAFNGYEITFEVSSTKGKTVGVYNISKTSKVVDEVSVKKVK